MNFSRFFLIFKFFFWQNDQNSRYLDIFSQKDYALQSRSFWVIDQTIRKYDSKIFLAKRDFRRIE